MSGVSPTDRPASLIMNNQNDGSIDFLDLGLPENLGDYCDPVLMAVCQNTQFFENSENDDMPVIEPEGFVEEMRPEVIQQDVPTTNNQLDFIMEVEQNLDKLVIHNPNQEDPTLTAINGRQDDWDLEMDDEFVYTDLDNCQQYDSYDRQQEEMLEFQPDQKEDFFQYEQHQQPYQINRMEVFSGPLERLPDSYPYPEIQKKTIFETKPSLPYSPALSPDYSVDSYFKVDNNTNYSPPPPPQSPRKMRSRKNSEIHSKIGMKNGKMTIGKVAHTISNEKPFRNRMTKAEMNKMTEKQKEDRKKGQNKVNAKNCVARKNNEKTDLGEKIEIWAGNLKIVERANGLQKNGLLSVYSTVIYGELQNNSQYGNLAQFEEGIELARAEIDQEIMYDNNGVLIDLQEKYQEAETEFEKFKKPKTDENLSQNTYASRKSRAKTAFELAKLRFEAKNLEVELEKNVKFSEKLEDFSAKINEILVGMGRGKQLAEKVVYDGFQTFEPS
ncbi:hypothetical protein L3Y34_000352 [Caenorhabditis briggsae]|uniref:BZIP domain-containing protein n=2 Tax=Caenorhabditis briggsae TaxID=6238 RepID=A0AAE9INJ9_CAEBR|nr:hypothetical protein L3Y34_000352 [Caenorhabditis briggsae]